MPIQNFILRETISFLPLGHGHGEVSTREPRQLFASVVLHERVRKLTQLPSLVLMHPVTVVQPPHCGSEAKQKVKAKPSKTGTAQRKQTNAEFGRLASLLRDRFLTMNI